LIPCWSGEVLSVAFAIDCHDREVLASVASPRPLAGPQIRTLMDRALWARFGEATLKAPHAIQWLSACYELLVKPVSSLLPAPLGGPIE
jgi:putative transposase